ncbi:hypothetical protein TruAng_008005 [Truncatella angustata]|nr:hypothetical protein TruAng_008005 [Truncatella angustata]
MNGLPPDVTSTDEIPSDGTPQIGAPPQGTPAHEFSTVRNSTDDFLTVPTATSSTSALTASAISTVILSVELQVVNDTQKRDLELQTRDEISGYVGDETMWNPSNCSDATVYRQSRGQLVAISKKRTLSVDPGVPYINMADYPGGSIETYNALQWKNETFYNGSAGFCMYMTGEVFATFTEAGGPSECIPIRLVVWADTATLSGTEFVYTSISSSISEEGTAGDNMKLSTDAQPALSMGLKSDGAFPSSFANNSESNYEGTQSSPGPLAQSSAFIVTQRHSGNSVNSDPAIQSTDSRTANDSGPNILVSTVSDGSNSSDPGEPAWTTVSDQPPIQTLHESLTVPGALFSSTGTLSPKDMTKSSPSNLTQNEGDTSSTVSDTIPATPTSEGLVTTSSLQNGSTTSSRNDGSSLTTLASKFLTFDSGIASIQPSEDLTTPSVTTASSSVPDVVTSSLSESGISTSHAGMTSGVFAGSTLLGSNDASDSATLIFSLPDTSTTSLLPADGLSFTKSVFPISDDMSSIITNSAASITTSGQSLASTQQENGQSTTEESSISFLNTADALSNTHTNSTTSVFTSESETSQTDSSNSLTPPTSISTPEPETSRMDNPNLLTTSASRGMASIGGDISSDVNLVTGSQNTESSDNLGPSLSNSTTVIDARMPTSIEAFPANSTLAAVPNGAASHTFEFGATSVSLNTSNETIVAISAVSTSEMETTIDPNIWPTGLSSSDRTLASVNTSNSITSLTFTVSSLSTDTDTLTTAFTVLASITESSLLTAKLSESSQSEFITTTGYAPASIDTKSQSSTDDQSNTTSNPGSEYQYPRSRYDNGITS